MKYISAVILLAFFFISAESKTPDVLDYYKMIPQKTAGNGFTRYNISKVNSQYKTMSNAEYELNALVDVKNGYLNITDEGTGGGTVIHEMAVFADSKKNKTIALNIKEMDGVTETSDLRFFKVSSGKWNDITSSILPPLSYKSFLKKSTLLKLTSDEKKIAEKLQLHYTLPRYGTTVKAFLSDLTLRTLYLMSSDYDDKTRKTAQSLIEKIDYEIIELNWSMKNGNFKVSKKISPAG